MEIIAEPLDAFDPEHPHFQGTELYNERWPVKTDPNQASRQRPLTRLFSRSLTGKGASLKRTFLPTAFAPRYSRDKLS